MDKIETKEKLITGWSIFDIGILTAMIVMFTPTFYRLATVGWRTADYTHAYFILPITLWLIWRKRLYLKKAEGFDKKGIYLFIFGVLCYLFGARNEFMFIEATSFVLVTWAVFMLRFTRESIKKILFPLAYLIFLIPPPSILIDLITLPLKKISTAGAYFFLVLFNMPVKVYGVVLNIGGQELFIADACSGFRSITSLMALGGVYAYLQPISLKRKVIIFLWTIPLAIIGNILRITITGLLAYYFGSDAAEGFIHESSGIILFIFVVIGLSLVTGKMVRDEEELG